MNTPNFYAIIPANVRYDTRLKPSAKLLYGEITALCNSKGFCWASNNYFSGLYGVSKRSITQWIKELSDAGYIHINLVYKEGTKEIERRELRILHVPMEENFVTSPKKVRRPNEENSHTPTEENFQDNTTSLNNTINNTKNNTASSSSSSGNTIYSIDDHEEKINDNDDDFRKIINFWEQNGFGLMSSKNIQDFTYWIQDFIEIGSTEENAIKLIIKSLESAVDNNVRKYNYVKAVLTDWESKRLLSIEQVEANEASRYKPKTKERDTTYDNLF